MVFGQVGVRYIEHLMVLKIKPSTDGCNTVVLEVGGWIGWYPGRGRYRAPYGTNKGPSINYLMPIGGLDSR